MATINNHWTKALTAFFAHYNCGCTNLLNFIRLSRFYRSVRLHSEIRIIIYSSSLFTLLLKKNRKNNVNDVELSEWEWEKGCWTWCYHLTYITSDIHECQHQQQQQHTCLNWIKQASVIHCGLGSSPPLQAWMFNIFQINEMRIE